MRNRILTALAGSVALAATLTQPARAQLVPRLVDYPAAAPACTAAAPGLAQRTSGATVAVYASSDCAPQTLLFTVSGSAALRRVTPTALGIATLERRCGQYTWQAGTERDVPAGGCDFVSGRPILSTVAPTTNTAPKP